MTTELQAKLDGLFHVTADDRATLRAGRMPPGLAEKVKKAGCLAWGAGLLGAGAGAFFAWNVHGLVESTLQVSPTITYAALTVVGGIAAYTLFQRRFGPVIERTAKFLETAAVHHYEGTAKIEERQFGAGALVFAKTTDGREIEVPQLAKGIVLDVPVRIFFVDFEPLRVAHGEDALPFKLPLYAFAIETTDEGRA